MTCPSIELFDVTETAIQLRFELSQTYSEYVLYWKEYGSDWAQADSTRFKADALRAKDGYVHVEANPCLPGVTYEVRMVGVDADGNISEPGRTMTVDTVTPGCGPSESTGCGCVVS
uniref:Fibronectin type-III domain-containing protein n=1 Tax=Leptocylindrus danicus TaxID=163516 RepID=A0A7S2LB98_9STRA|mmetsp:Transcript_34392/g.49955  ORF Transcript_34392/g.49955 Transcript_34392/m.49955 type:complete len:116 (+) Transcript_34392:98-445(+)|eukprot:CAMPEP_0116021316 /NCGR_PEP_ID=MMETSP0321-20121206/10318_1 /TAXON_ID=163516 /ORGANISM="Leptocylindrus danicus var. danicus, Strain B650" /LENGTH=115 /DNA_ID=CAMNT_0003492171 /DNA_START=80 /DNA_END=427 /DNA_ORIENTATION=-